LSPPEVLLGVVDEPVFAEPWQAQVFALTLALNERELFTWTEWAEALGAALKDGAADGNDYYERWLAALETLLVQKNIATAPEVADLTAAWHRAAEATPHGKPILLENDPLGGRS
jgi:nitrile hydratase accessory protein